MLRYFYRSLWLVCFSFTFLQAEKETIEFIFSKNANGFVGDFADYPVGEEVFYNLAWGWTTLPKELPFESCQTLTKGLFLSGDNHSDNLFMFLRRRIDGLQPNTWYALKFSVTIEDNIPPGQVGIGGSPGEDVYFKVGASRKEPRKVDVDGFYFLNVDKGFQSNSGKDAITVGNLANPLVDPSNPQYFPKQFHNDTPLKVKTDPKGRLWIFVGTDSGFEGPTVYYVAEVTVTAKPLHLKRHPKCRQKTD